MNSKQSCELQVFLGENEKSALKSALQVRL